MYTVLNICPVYRAYICTIYAQPHWVQHTPCKRLMYADTGDADLQATAGPRQVLICTLRTLKLECLRTGGMPQSTRTLIQSPTHPNCRRIE